VEGHTATGSGALFKFPGILGSTSYTHVSVGVLRKILVPKTQVTEDCIYSLFNDAQKLCVYVVFRQAIYLIV
jgi:hypothetical protein